MDAKNSEFLPRKRRLTDRFPLWAMALAGAAILAVAIVLVFDWNWMRGPLARYASRQTGRHVAIHGDLRVHLFSTLPSATIEGLEISNPDWAPAGDTAKIPEIFLQFRLWPLLRGEFVWNKIVARSPDISLLRDARGRATWEFGRSAAENAKPLQIPPIRHFLISNGRVRIDDRLRRMLFSGTLAAKENSGSKGEAAFRMVGKGTLNRRAFEVDVSGGPLINVDREKPYPFRMEVRSATTHVRAHASILHPFDLGRLDGSVTFSGANLADLYYLTGIAFPRTGPYRLDARVARDGTSYRVSNLSGTVGNSDLEGGLTVDIRSGRPYLTADLHSRRLDFVDLGPLIGGAPSPAKIAKAAAKAGVPPRAAQARVSTPQNRRFLLPDVPLAVDRVNQMDAHIRYRAQSVTSQDFPLRRFGTTVTLDHGVLKADPVSFALTKGIVSGAIAVDARGKTPALTTDIRVRDIKLEQFAAKRKDGTSMLEGTVDARAVLSGTGASIHEAASTANGDVRVIVPGGAIRQQFAELLGISVDRAFLLAGNNRTDIRCIVGDFSARNGILTARSLVFDTDVMNVTGKGTVDMRRERMTFELSGHPKKPTLFRLRAPITVSGPLDAPQVGIESGGIPAQAGAAAILGAVATPLAAILPFIDPGLAKNADCAALERAAPVAAKPKRR